MTTICLVILDGWGYAPNWGGNPIGLARPKTFNFLQRSNPTTVLACSGEQVGLPGHEAGNSEVGHLNIGAGRVVALDQTMITESIKDGSFYRNQAMLTAFHRAKRNGANVHVMGLLSDSGVHSYLDHLFALIELAANQKVDQLYLHLFTDGRDSPPQSALSLLARVEQAFELFKAGQVATVSGRFFAMDRDRHFERTQQVLDAMVKGKGPKFVSARQAIAAAYKQGLSDEYIPASVISRFDGQPKALVGDRDSLIFFNFRADRARQITQMTLRQLPGIQLVTFVPYGFAKEFKLPLHAAFTPQPVQATLTELVAHLGFEQFHIAETEKYAHVTYFFNGGIEEPFSGEERLLVPSPKVVSFASKPEMAAPEITTNLVKRLDRRRYAFLVANFANADMIGHTGDIQAAIQAVGVLDEQLRQIAQSCQKNNTVLVVTADHGNIEQMIDPITGEVDTEHSTNPVPFVLVPPPAMAQQKLTLRDGGKLADIAPTILQLAGIEQPSLMTGTALQKVV